MMKNHWCLLVLPFCWPVHLLLQTLKFGHIDSGQLIQMMPQTKQADSTPEKIPENPRLSAQRHDHGIPKPNSRSVKSPFNAWSNSYLQKKRTDRPRKTVFRISSKQRKSLSRRRKKNCTAQSWRKLKTRLKISWKKNTPHFRYKFG